MKSATSEIGGDEERVEKGRGRTSFMGFSSSVAKANRKCPTEASLLSTDDAEEETASSSLGAPAMRPSPTNCGVERKEKVS